MEERDRKSSGEKQGLGFYLFFHHGQQFSARDTKMINLDFNKVPVRHAYELPCKKKLGLFSSSVPCKSMPLHPQSRTTAPQKMVFQLRTQARE